MKTAETIYYLKGLHCANCAEKIAREVEKKEGVLSSHMDVLSQRLMITYTQENKKMIQSELQKIVDHIEPGVIVQAHQPVVEKEKVVTAKNMRILIGSIGFALGLFFQSHTWSLYLFSFSYALIGWDVIVTAVRNGLKGDLFDENFLMGIATIGAFAIGEYPEGVAVMLFYQIGEAFQDRAVSQSRHAIKSLLNIRPDVATRVDGFETIEVPAEGINIGDKILVKPGERVPLDGIVIHGNSHLDTSALTGESVPREAKLGDLIYSGVINLNGVLTLEVTKDFANSTVSKILELVQNASSKKSKTENFITKFARIYTPIVVFSATLIAFVPPMFFSGDLRTWVYRALVFLVVSCPCALVISIPLGFFGGIGGASKHGILIKGGNYLEALNHVHTVVFDKTGTLTQGKFAVQGIEVKNGWTSERLLHVAAHAEAYTTHPIGKSIALAYGKALSLEKVSQVTEKHGLGIEAIVEGQKVLIGNQAFLSQHRVDITSIDRPALPGEATIYVAVEGKEVGAIRIADCLKSDSKVAISQLRNRGVKEIVMLTGDQKDVALRIGNELGVDAVHAELFPTDKVMHLEKIEKKLIGTKGQMVFVGDGINDAPVLARADIGIAMGGLGSDAAIEAADIVIMTDEPSKIGIAMDFAKMTRAVVIQNIIFAMGIKLIVLILGASGHATMWEAVFADVGVALIAVLNASRVLRYNPKVGML